MTKHVIHLKPIERATNFEMPDITQDERIRRTRANLALSSLRLLATRWVIQGGSAEELANLCGLTKDELSDLTGRAW